MDAYGRMSPTAHHPLEDVEKTPPEFDSTLYPSNANFPAYARELAGFQGGKVYLNVTKFIRRKRVQ